MPEDLYLQVGNFKTRYWSAGEKGTAVILIHGLAVSADIWTRNIEGLAAEHRVYVPDLPGFGRADHPPPYFSPFDYSRFLDDFIKLLHLDRVSLVGQSLGGGVSLHYTLMFPEKVDRLVLVDSAGMGREVIWTLRYCSLPLVGETFLHPNRKGIEMVFKLAVGDPSLITRDFVDLYYEFFSRPGFKEFFLRLLRRLVTFRGARDEFLLPIMNNLTRITQSALIVWGDRDQVLPLKHAYYGKEKLPNARLKIFPGCGHIPFFERPQEFNRLVLDFLAGRID